MRWPPGGCASLTRRAVQQCCRTGTSVRCRASNEEMRCPLLWLLLFPAMAVGCLSTGRSSSPSVSSVAQPSPQTAATSLRVSYPFGDIVTKRSQLPACPNRAICHDVHLGDCPAGSSCVQFRPWTRVAVRRFTCSPNAGDYRDPNAACAALADLEHLLHTGQAGVCSCPGSHLRVSEDASGGPLQRSPGHDQTRLLLSVRTRCSGWVRRGPAPAKGNRWATRLEI